MYKFPYYVMFCGLALIHTGGGQYWRAAGHHGVKLFWADENGTLMASPEEVRNNEILKGQVATPCDRKTWLIDNGQHAKFWDITERQMMRLHKEDEEDGLPPF